MRIGSHGVASTYQRTRAPKMMTAADTELRELVRLCVEGDSQARVRFQTLLGEFIYNSPMNLFRLPEDMAGDFYIYVFEKDRIFKRLSNFEGRNGAQFKTYLSYYVLWDLFLEWQRSQKDIEAVSFEATLSENDSGRKSLKLGEILADPDIDDVMENHDARKQLDKLMSTLDAERTTILKLLHLVEFDLAPQDIRLISQKSGRSYKEVVIIIRQMRSDLSKKDERVTSLEDQLESIFGRILLYQRELHRLSEKLKSKTQGSPEYTKVVQERDEIERKLNWRYQQQAHLIKKVSQFHITTPYKDIARLLNVPVGTVCSWIARLRADILKDLRSPENQSQPAVS